MTAPRLKWPTKNHVLLRLKQHPLTLGDQKSACPVVTIDGVERSLEWGDQLLPYWDERPVTITVAVPARAWRSIRTHFGRVEITLPAATGRSCEYAAPPNGYAGGVIGALGTTRAKGTAAAVILVAISTVVFTATAVVVALGIVAAIGAASGGL